MSTKLVILKLLWSNLKYLKEHNESPDNRFDFLKENEMVHYLFNEDSRYIELLMMSLDIQPLDILEKLNPTFVSMYKNFFESETMEANSKVEHNEKTVKKNSKKEKHEEKEVKKEEVNETKSVHVEEDEESVVMSEDDSVELSDSEMEEDSDIIKFINENLITTTDDSKLSLESIKKKYLQYCEENDMTEDTEELEVSLVTKFGKPKGKKKNFKALRFL